MFFGVPVMLGANGMEKIIEYDLNDEERAEFDKSSEAVKELHDALKNVVKI